MTRIKHLELGIKLLIPLFFILIALFLPKNSFAQTPATSLQPTTYNLPTNVSPTSPLYTDLLVNNLFHSFSCLAIGQSVIDQPCLTYMQGVPVLSKVNTSGGVLGSTTNLIGMLYQNPPVRTTDYLASVGQGLGLVKTANAQVGGSGAQILSPIFKLWEVSRNISYVFLIIIFLVIGLMVMFRNKLNPQTVITAQAALPGLIIGLIMITLSYFFAGLISDTAFLGTNVVGYYFVAAQDKLNLPTTTDPKEAQDWKEQQDLVKKMSGQGVLSIFSQFSGIVTQDKAQSALAIIYQQLSPEVQERISWLAGLIAYQVTSSPAKEIPLIGQFIGPVVGLFGAGVASNNPSAVLGIVVAFISTFVLIYAMLKLLLRLVTAYLTIVFLTITAPFQFLFASLPGRQEMATGWMLSMLGNILIFPAVIAIFYFIAYILGTTYGPLKVADLNQPPEGNIVHTAYAAGDNQIVGTTTFPLFGGMDLSFINIILAFGALVALPSIPDLIVKSIGKAGQAGQILGQEISGSLRGGQGYAGRIPGGVQGMTGELGKGVFGQSQYYSSPTGLHKGTISPGLIHIRQIKKWF